MPPSPYSAITCHFIICRFYAQKNMFWVLQANGYYLVCFHNMGFLGAGRRITTRKVVNKRQKRPRDVLDEASLFPGDDGETSTKKTRLVNVQGGSTLENLPLEILEEIFLFSGNPSFSETSKAIFSRLGGGSEVLQRNMLLNWIEPKKQARDLERGPADATDTGEVERQPGVGERNFLTPAAFPDNMTAEEVAQDIQDHIHHPRAFHIDDMEVETTEIPLQDQNSVSFGDPVEVVELTLALEHLSWKFVTRQLLDSLNVSVSGEHIPESYGLAAASYRKKSLLPLLQQSGLKFLHLSDVYSAAVHNPDHLKWLLSLGFGSPTMATLVTSLKKQNGHDLITDRNNMDFLPNWLIKAGYYADKLGGDELWTFLLANGDSDMVQYFLGLGVVPSERVLHKFPGL